MRSRGLRVVFAVLPALILVVIALSGWEAYVRLENVNGVILPAPSAIGQTLWDEKALLVDDLWVTLREIVYGFGAGFLIGVVCGVLIVYSKTAERTLYPLVIASQVIPVFAIAPLLIIWFGFGIEPKVIICALIVFFPICVNMVEGLRSAEKGIVEVMRSYGARESRIFRSVRLPAAVPYLLIGTQVGITFAVIGAVIAEWVGADAGLGYRMVVANSQSETSLVFAAIVTLAVVGVALFALVRVSATASSRGRRNSNRSEGHPRRGVPMKRITIVAFAATGVACLALAAAATAKSERGDAPKALTKVTFMADYPRPPWVAQIPWVVAMKKGWYKAAGLDVKYVFPSTPADPARFIGIGRADVTVSYTPDLLTAASKGLKVKALASVFDRNVEGIMVWKDSGITTPKQLEGHTVAIYDFPMAKLNWQTFAQHYGINSKKVKIVSEGNYGVPLMVSNKVDAIDAAAPSELVDAELQAKKQARFWVYLKENGIPDFYWFVLAANSDWANKNPAAAKAFVSVTMKAVKWSFQHQQEAVDTFVQTYKKDVSPELASKAWAQIVKYDSTRFKPRKPAGWMDPAVWKSYQQFLTTKKFLTDPVNLDDVLTGNQFVAGAAK